MLKIIEVASKEKLDEYKAKEDHKYDYLYILKYCASLLLSDNGNYIAMCQNNSSSEGEGGSSSSDNDLLQNLIATDGTKFRFGIDNNGNYGYTIKDSEGADTVMPFKKNVSLSFEEIYNKKGTSIKYSYTVTKEGYYSVYIRPGATSSNINSTGTILYSTNISAINCKYIYCKPNDTITLSCGFSSTSKSYALLLKINIRFVVLTSRPQYFPDCKKTCI